MPTLYLHIGPHKTGSTYLQTTFAEQGESLKRQGILYPSTGREFAYGHHNIAWFFADRPLIKTTRDELSKNIALLANSREYKILLSSEEFARIPENKLNDLKLAFPEYDFHILYFARKGIGLVVSLWQEMIKQGIAIPMDKIDLSEMHNFFNYNPFAHDENIAKFEKHLNGTTTVFDYSKLISENKNIVNVVSNALNIKIESDEKTVNASMPLETIELIRAANIYNFSLGKPRRGFPRKMCLAMLQTKNGTALKKYIEDRVRNLSQNVPGKHFINMGFTEAHLTEADLTKGCTFVPENLLLEQLNKDDILPWQILKKQIEDQ